MKRFMGMMPIHEIEKQVVYRDQYNMKVVIQAGKHGWTILWADKSIDYEDIDSSTDENFNKAYQEATQASGLKLYRTLK